MLSRNTEMNDADIDIGSNDAIYTNAFQQMTRSRGTMEAVTVGSSSGCAGTTQPERLRQGTPPNHAPEEMEEEEARLGVDS